MTIIEYIGSIGGIAGVLAFLIFVSYRHLVTQMRQDRKYMEDRMSQIISEYNRTTSENTRILSELFTYLRMKNGGS